MSRSARSLLLLLLSLGSASAHAKKQHIIDVGAEKHAKHPQAKPAPDLQLTLSESETSRNLSQSIVDQLVALGYVVAPEISYGHATAKGQTKPSVAAPDPKALLHVEIVRVSGSCIVTAKATAFSSQDVALFTYETQDDSLPCADQLKRAIAEFSKAHPPGKPPSGAAADALPDPSEGAAPVEKHPAMVLAPTVVRAEESAGETAETGSRPPTEAAPAVEGSKKEGAAMEDPEPAPVAKRTKGFGCSTSAGDPGAWIALAGLAGAWARRRSARR